MTMTMSARIIPVIARRSIDDAKRGRGIVAVTAIGSEIVNGTEIGILIIERKNTTMIILRRMRARGGRLKMGRGRREGREWRMMMNLLGDEETYSNMREIF
jgi:hypothetical protein